MKNSLDQQRVYASLVPEREAGVVLMILAMLVLAFATFLALALDVPAIGGSQRKKHEAAQLGALAFLSAYNSATVSVGGSPSDHHRERMTAALERLEEVVGFRNNDIQFGGVGRQTDPNANEIKDLSGVVPGHNANVAGEIQPGNWFFEEPQEGCAAYPNQNSSCPCPGGNWQGECFLPLGPGDNNLSAVEVSLNSTAASPLRLFFGRIFGSPSTPLSARARASMRPRVFLTGIDLSRSVAFDTHIPWDSVTGAGSNLSDASEYVFPLAAGANCGGSHVNPCLTAENPTDLGAGCQFEANSYFHIVWYSLDPTRDDTRKYPKTKHFQDDYSCWEVGGRSYLIDTAIHDYGYHDALDNPVVEGQYWGPEPLVTILASFREAMNEMELKSVSGDRIVLYGFDQDADTNGPRFIGPTNKSDSVEWNKLRDVTNVYGVADMPGTGTEDPLLKKRIIDHQLIPRPPASYTDLAGALFAAYNSVANLNFGGNANVQLTIASDGLTNVKHDPFMTMTNGVIEMGPDKFDRSNCTAVDRRQIWYDGCWRWHDHSLAQAIIMVTKEQRFWGRSPWWYGWETVYPDGFGFKYLSKVGFKINFALFGRDVQPHILFKKSQARPTQCMSDMDARSTYTSSAGNDQSGDWSNPFVFDGPFWTNNDVQSCYAVLGAADGCNKSKYPLVAQTIWRGIVLPTGGRFLPIRPPCDAAAVNAELPTWGITAGSCKDGELEKKLASEICSPYAGEPGASDVDPNNHYRNNYGEEYTINRWSEGGIGGKVQQLLDAGVLNDSMEKLDQTIDPPVVEDKEPHKMPKFNTRLVCDTRCQTPEEQMRGLYRELFRTNPYVLVRDDV